MNNDTVYIHYGRNRYYKDNLILSLEIGISNGFNKPIGLWGSPENSEYGWKEWCEGEGFHIEKLNKSFRFKLTDNTNILHVYESDDIRKYVEKKDKYLLNKLNTDIIKDEGYDGIELHLSKSRDYIELYHDLMYGWDCDSIVVWNPDSIIQL